MANPLFSIEKLPTTSAAAIREFDERYIAAVGASVPSGWADTLGALVPTNAPQTTFPVSQLRTKYRRYQGEQTTKDLGEAFIDLKVEEFQDGYEAPLKQIFEQVFAYQRWQEAPGRLVLAEEQFRHTEIAALLTDGVNQTSYDGASGFFATDHPANIDDAALGTWSNFNAGALDVVSVANLETQITAMMGVLDENGEPMGVTPDTILAPIAKAEALKNLLKQQRISDSAGGGDSTTIDNPYMNAMDVRVVKEFGLSSLDWYLVDSKLIGEMSPWISLRQNVPPALALRRFDEDSDYFKNTSRIKMSSHIWYAHALAIPHAIRKVTGA